MIRLRLAPRSTLHRTVVSTLAVALLLLPLTPVAAQAVEEPAPLEKLGRAQDDTAPHSRSHILVRIAGSAQAFRALGTVF